MARYGGTESRNNGWGKQLEFAGKNALRTTYGGQFATIKSHSDRWAVVCKWLQNSGVTDTRDIDRGVVQSYGAELRERVESGLTSVSYAQNLISSLNQVMIAVREDRSCWISPADTVGQRSSVRTEAPNLDRAPLYAAIVQLRESGNERPASVVELARELGLRERETAQLDLRQAIHEATTDGEIRITLGTKGGAGHGQNRLVPVSEYALAALYRALESAQGGKNLIPQEQSRQQFLGHVQNVVLPVLKEHGVGTVHDQRAAYACERYQEITGYPAPVIVGVRLADKEPDHAAREIITGELGHGRISVTAAYLGSLK